MNIYHILTGKAVNINSNIVRYFSTSFREMGTEKEDHLFIVLQDKNELSAQELEFYQSIAVGSNRLTFIPQSKLNILKTLFRVGGRDLVLIHSARSNDLFFLLMLTPWLWKNTALICFGGEPKIWQRIASAGGWKNRALRLSQKIVVPGIRAVCTLTPGEFEAVRTLFPGAANYQRAFMATSPRVDTDVLDGRAGKTNPTVRVLLNQSANVGGRHWEAIGWLSKFKEEDIRITCPVSFGEEGEAEEVIRSGREYLGDKFSFIRDKRPFDEYSRMVKEDMDILVLNHLGQAGLGHLYMFLCMGKVAYIRRESPVFEHLTEIGIEVRATNSIPGMSFEDFSRPLTRETAEKNIRNFNASLSTEASVESCKRLIRMMREGHE